ncbi:NAD(P)-dependent oxidoreductase [Flectobacillus sp. DC10W]|uniref:dTDP-4-dehydrorhamnose reductase n=1 Tax=Flectobacillus longus TaxID=2984207 RepID=A0ABT6YP27_9BACT|nr:NAD(P)-dependent oxidoreductase [Flectobacillus longus]MDI9865270.1 NAD(P)-dependent oxidoreductase [Flectobacillus longus]
MQKILITGANGLLGQKLVHLLVNNPTIELIATARGKSRLSISEGFSYQEMDLSDPVQIQEVIDKVRPDSIIHTAAMTNVDMCHQDPEGCWEANVTAVEYLIEQCQRHNIYLCHVSTDFVFDGENGPYHEEDQPAPISVYGKSKYEAELRVQASGLRWSIIRTVLVYGIVPDMSRSNIILWVKNSLERGQAIKVVSDQLRTPTLAEDLALGCWLATQRHAQGIYHISGKDFMSPYDMAIATANYFALDKTLITEVTADTFTQEAKRPPRTGFILNKAINELGYNPVSFEEGISVMVKQLNAIHD